MEEALKRTNERLKVDENIRRIYIEAFDEVYHIFRSYLNETDPLFETYQKKINTGSHAIKTKVGIPNEFDVNLCVKLPLILTRNITFRNSTKPGYIQIKTSPNDWTELKKNPGWEKCKSIEKWVDAEGFLLESKIRAWMESKVQEVLTKLKVPRDRAKYFLSVSKSGPAFTLKVDVGPAFASEVGTTNFKDIHFSVDLVPSIGFEYPNWPCNVQQKYVNKYSTNEWFAIAKPLHDKKEEGFFRVSFPLQEIEMFDSQDHLKSALRLIKMLRDSCQLTYIPTYYINTLFLWKIEEASQNYWQQPLSKIFLEMLLELDKAFNSGVIRCYWIEHQNLLDSLTSSQIQDGRKKLNSIIREIKTYPEKIDNIILYSRA